MDSSNREGNGPPAAVKAVAIILILILVLIVALLVRSGNRHAAAAARSVGATGGGGDEDPAPPRPHTLGDALHKVRMDQARRPGDAHVSGPPPPQVLGPPPKKVVRHGGRAEKKAPKPKKPWTQYETWEALFKDEGAHAAYWDDVATSLNTLELDWGEVRKALAKTVYDNREWAGRINYVDGKLKVVELVPSPHAVGEGPLAKQAGAMVPAEVMQKLEAKPGLFLFHTHPGEVGGSSNPSAMDMAGAMHIGYTGRYAGEVVVSPYGVFLYTPSGETRQRIWSAEGDDPHREKKALLTMLRHTADLLGAFDGARSWTTPWTLDDYASLARRYGMEYVVFPNDSYIHQEHRLGFSSLAEVDHDTHQDYLARIKELEEEAAEQTVAATPENGRDLVRRVRFAPGV
jgi:hypothetical protein